ncbi:hypothetical protein D1224_13405 [Henriciella barbarensis]|uniref:Uncharacterized protein n=2 Tax=Henriciella barbarensis TaxID=86342 RepID=A0A399QUX6_9PROT|nr:hypothetical protein D1224_13405 [Henriciella barbarensis]
MVLGAVVCANNAYADDDQSISPYDQARLIELELRSLSADRIAEYLLPERDADKLAVELIFDRHEHYNTRKPATAFRFERDGTGLWKGWRVDGRIPIGSSAYWAFDLEQEDKGYICKALAIEISSDVAQSLHALAAVDWKHAPTFSERDSSHPTMVGIRVIDDDRREERYFAYLQSPADPMFDYPPELAEQFEREYEKFERYVVELAQEVDFGRTDCSPSNATLEVPRKPSLDERHQHEFAQIRARMNIAYAAIQEAIESKE